MARDDWFRRTTWTEQDQQEFWSRWKRSRTPFHKAQYLRIQGLTLIDQPDPALIRTGIELTRRMLNEFPEVRTQTAIAQASIGEGLTKLGSLEAALEAFRSAVATEREYPSVQTNAARKFALLVATEGLCDHDDEAEQLLDEARARRSGGALPFEIFIDAGARAVFAANRGDTVEAGRWARAAIEQADRTTSGLQYHPEVGLVPRDEPLYGSLLERVSSIASDSNPP